ncbi:MAG: murein L,D-transpeptidase family protein, partial [Chitinophagales bacterium]
LNLDSMTMKKLFFLPFILLTIFSFRDGSSKRLIRKSFFNRHLDGEISIVVIKENYELKVYDQDGWYATYPVVFGSKTLDDKMMEGDRKTPEGVYHIASKRPHEKWDKMMVIDYPTKSDFEKFNQRKSQGLIPKGAKIGGGIAIHGTWAHDDIAVDLYQNWTNGCIALKDEDVDELYEIAPIGTKVTILKSEQ